MLLWCMSAHRRGSALVTTCVWPVVFAAVFTSSARSQDVSGSTRAKLIVVNTLIGGATAGITAAINHRPIWRAFVYGSAGGAVVFGGKCLVAQQHSLTDWIGRETVAIGSSVVANAAAGRPALSRVALPLGPVRFYRDNASKRIRLKLDVAQVIGAAYLASERTSSMDWKESLEHGGLIIFTRGGSAMEVAGAVRIWDRESGRMLAHEQTHAVQNEFLSIALEEPLESWLLPHLPGGRSVNRYFDVGVLTPVWGWINSLIPAHERPWEKEANAFDGSC